MASDRPKKLQSGIVSSTTPEKIDVDSLVDRILNLTHKLDLDIYEVVLIKSKLTEVSEKLIEANAHGSTVDMSILSDIKLLEYKIGESGINATLIFIKNFVDSFLGSLQEHVNYMRYEMSLCLKGQKFVHTIGTVQYSILKLKHNILSDIDNPILMNDIEASLLNTILKCLYAVYNILVATCRKVSIPIEQHVDHYVYNSPIPIKDRP